MRTPTCHACGKPITGPRVRCNFDDPSNPRSPLNGVTFLLHAACIRLVIPDGPPVEAMVGTVADVEPSRVGRDMRRAGFTPWVRDAVHSAGIDRDELEARVPVGFILDGHADRPRGPYTFRIRPENGHAIRQAVAPTWRHVAGAIDTLLGEPLSLTAQLAASLDALEVKP